MLMVLQFNEGEERVGCASTQCNSHISVHVIPSAFVHMCIIVIILGHLYDNIILLICTVVSSSICLVPFQPMKIHVSESTAELLHEAAYILQERGEMQIKVHTRILCVWTAYLTLQK